MIIIITTFFHKFTSVMNHKNDTLLTFRKLIKGSKYYTDVTLRDVRISIIIVSGLTGSPFSGQEMLL